MSITDRNSRNARLNLRAMRSENLFSPIIRARQLAFCGRRWAQMMAGHGSANGLTIVRRADGLLVTMI